jgi:DNA-binding transcriptional ArsR family regulator
MALRPHSLDQRQAKAMSHALRAQALELIAHRGAASPKDLAVQLGVDIRTVAYHVRVLRKLGCVELAETHQRRGAVEHVYRLAEEPPTKD